MTDVPRRIQEKKIGPLLPDWEWILYYRIGDIQINPDRTEKDVGDKALVIDN